jgi:hypothetical protein
MLWDKIIFWGFALAGLCIGVLLIYLGWTSVENPSVSSSKRHSKQYDSSK